MKKEKGALKDSKKQQIDSARRKKLVVTIIGILAGVLFAGVVIYVFSKPPASRPKIGDEVAIQGAEHIAVGSTHKPYSTNPPTSGPHWEKQAECKIYTEEIPDEAAIHSLEHGAVWITYKDKTDTQLVKKLTDLVKQSGGKLLLSPREKNDSPIAVVSWGRIMKLQKFDEVQLRQFIRYNKNQSPEPLASC